MTGTPNGAEVVGSASPAKGVELKAREMAATEHSTTGKWSEVTSGDVLTLQRGFDLPKAKRKPGSHPVIASTGPVGTHNEAMVEGPGVVIGRSGGLGSGVSTLNRNHVHPLPVSLPPLSEQRAIAHILSTLDDKIELNRRMNQILEEMAHAVFKDWFIYFGPTRAKVESWEPYLPAEVWDLFPDSFVDSELGEIPESWGVKALGECFNLTMGQSPPGRTYNESGEGLPFFRGRTDFGFRYPENRRFCSEPKRIAEADDRYGHIRVARRGTVNGGADTQALRGGGDRLGAES